MYFTTVKILSLEVVLQQERRQHSTGGPPTWGWGSRRGYSGSENTAPSPAPPRAWRNVHEAHSPYAPESIHSTEDTVPWRANSRSVQSWKLIDFHIRSQFCLEWKSLSHSWEIDQKMEKWRKIDGKRARDKAIRNCVLSPLKSCASAYIWPIT